MNTKPNCSEIGARLNARRVKLTKTFPASNKEFKPNSLKQALAFPFIVLAFLILGVLFIPLEIYEQLREAIR